MTKRKLDECLNEEDNCGSDQLAVANTSNNWGSQISGKKAAPLSDSDNQVCDEYVDETNVPLISPSPALGSSTTASVADCQVVIPSKRVPYPDDDCSAHSALLGEQQQVKKTTPSTGVISVRRNSQKMKQKRNSCVDADSCSSDQDLCRICQIGEAEDGGDSPLISPCRCTGSVKYVHQTCLQKWIKGNDIKSCELCKYEFKMQTKLKPFSKWEKLDMTTSERRKILCSIGFHLLAVTCVIWSLYVLIQRTALEIRQKEFHWPFWTKLIVVAIGFVGGLVFMYVQCKVYVQLWRRLKAYNRVIYVQNNPTLTTTTAATTIKKTTEKSSSSSSTMGLSVATSPVQCQQTTSNLVFNRSEEDNNSKQIASKANNSDSQRVHIVHDRDDIRSGVMQFMALSPATEQVSSKQYQINFEGSNPERTQSEILSMQIASENIASVSISSSFNINNATGVGNVEILIDRPDIISDPSTKNCNYQLQPAGGGFEEIVRSDPVSLRKPDFVVEMASDIYSNPSVGSDAGIHQSLIVSEETQPCCSQTSKKCTNVPHKKEDDDVDPKMSSCRAKMKQKHQMVLSSDDCRQDFTTATACLEAKHASATDV